MLLDPVLRQFGEREPCIKDIRAEWKASTPGEAIFPARPVCREYLPWLLKLEARKRHLPWGG